MVDLHGVFYGSKIATQRFSKEKDNCTSYKAM